MLSPELRQELAFLRNLYMNQKQTFAQTARPRARTNDRERLRGVANVALLLVLLLIPLS